MKLYFNILLLCLFCFHATANELNLHSTSTSLGLEIQIAFGNGKTINAIFDSDSQISQYAISGVSSDQMFLSSSEQNLLRATLDRRNLAKNNSENLVNKLLEFSAEVIPTNEIVHPYQTKNQFSLAAQWTSICLSFGQTRMATYTVGPEVFNVTSLVGDSARCTGRCGTGCWQLGQKKANQYTQECMNHDLCKDITGQNLGVCEDEFWAAAPGYLHSPNCF